jgi:hypothetical protein
MGAAVATAALLLALSGCIRMTTDITLHEDNTVSGEIVMAVQEGSGAMMDMTDDELVASMNEDNPAGKMTDATVSKYNEDGYVGTRVTFKNEPLDNFSGVDGTITREGDTFVFKGTAPDSEETSQAPPGAVATMSVTFPGAVSDHNGTLEGNTVTWDLLTLTEAPYATGSAIGGGGGSSAATILILGGAVLLALIIVGVVLLNRRKTPAAPEEDAPPAPAA